MNILEIAKRVGSGLVRELVPGGGLLIDAVNQFLPDEKKLPQNATGINVERLIEGSLPLADRALLLKKQFDVDLSLIDERKNATTQGNETLRVMLAQDAVTPHTTRPKIALGCFWVLAYEAVGIISTWAYAVITGNYAMAQAIQDGWPFVVSVITPFVTLLWAYFGILKQENRDKLDAANNLPTRAGGIISSILKR